jgi:hypothetical protein
MTKFALLLSGVTPFEPRLTSRELVVVAELALREKLFASE